MVSPNDLHFPSPSSEEMDIEELKKQVWRDRVLLKCLLKDHKPGYDIEDHSRSQEQAWMNTQMSHAQDGSLKNMLKTMEDCKAQGFVYGIIPEKGKPIIGCSDNLHSCWKEKVRFDLNGPLAISESQSEAQRNIEDSSSDVLNSALHTLQELLDTTLGPILSALMQHCDLLQRRFPLEEGVPAPWWPTGEEERPAQFDLENNGGPPPSLENTILPDVDEIQRLISQSKSVEDKMTARERSTLHGIINREEALHWNLSSNNFHGSPSNTMDGFALFNDANEYDVEGVDCDGEVESKLLSMETETSGLDLDLDSASKRKHIATEELVDQNVYTCEFQNCPHSYYTMGFEDRTQRNNHQINCQYRLNTVSDESNNESSTLSSATSESKSPAQITSDLSELGMPEDDLREISELMSYYDNHVQNADSGDSEDQNVQFGNGDIFSSSEFICNLCKYYPCYCSFGDGLDVFGFGSGCEDENSIEEESFWYNH